MNDSAIIFNEVIESYTKLSLKGDEKKTSFNEKKKTCKTQDFYSLHAFLLIAVAILTAVSINCYLIKIVQKHLLPFKNTNDKKTTHTTFFDDIINIKNFDPNNIKVDENSYKNILIHYIAYVTIKDSKQININNVNPLYVIFNKWNGHFEENNGDKYLTLVPTNENNRKIKKV